MSKFPYQQIRKVLESLRATSDKLYALSQHFFAVGNEHVGYKLKDMANDLHDSLECIDEISAMLAVTKENQGERR